MPHLHPHRIEPAGIGFAALALVMAVAALFAHFSALPTNTVTIVLSVGALVSGLCAWLHLHWHE